MDSEKARQRKLSSSVFVTQVVVETEVLPPESVGTILVTIRENEFEFALTMANARPRQPGGHTHDIG
jgi:hypothetical protein